MSKRFPGHVQEMSKRCPRASLICRLAHGGSEGRLAFPRLDAATQPRPPSALRMRIGLLLLLLICTAAWAHPSRPECGGPERGHGPASPGSGGYSLSAPAGGVAANATAALTLRGPAPFRGFLVTPTGNAARGGAFTAPPGTRLVCGGVGHASSAVKEAVTLPWRAPDAPGDVAFTFYVLASAAEWYGPLHATVAVHGGAADAKKPL